MAGQSELVRDAGGDASRVGQRKCIVGRQTRASLTVSGKLHHFGLVVDVVNFSLVVTVSLCASVIKVLKCSMPVLQIDDAVFCVIDY